MCSELKSILHSDTGKESSLAKITPGRARFWAGDSANLKVSAIINNSRDDLLRPYIGALL